MLPPRQRLHDAIVDVVVERGYARASIDSILKRAGVGRAEFDRHFTGKEDACVQTFEAISTRCNGRILGAYREAEGSWRDRIRAAAYEIARVFRDSPREGRFCVYELVRAGGFARERRATDLELYADILDEGRREMADADSLPDSTAHRVVGSIVLILIRQLSGDEFPAPELFVPELMYVAVFPYLGPEAALEELSSLPPGEPLRTAG